MSPKILDKPKKSKKKKVAKGKAKKKRKQNGSARLKERAEMLIQIQKDHGVEIRRLFKKHGKVRPVVVAMKKHRLKESQTYQTMNFMGLISTGTAQKKLARMKEAGFLK